MLHSRSLILAVVLVCSTRSSSVAEGHDVLAQAGSSQEPRSAAVSQNDVQRARLLLNGIWNSFEEIHSGILEMREDIVWTTGEKEWHEYFIAFDYERDMMRWDRRGARRKTRFARNDKEILLQIDTAANIPRIERYPRDYDLDIEDARPFDYRGIAATLWPAMRGKNEFGMVRKFVDGLDDAMMIEFVDQDDEVQIRFEFPCADKTLAGQELFVLSRKQGMRLALFEERYQKTDPDGKKQDWYVESRTETSWTLKGDTWVPRQSKVAAVRTGHVADLVFDWRSVNESIADSTFEITGMQVPDDTRVVNFKMGTAIPEGTVGEPKIVAQLGNAQSQNRGSSIRWLVSANLAVLVALLGWYGFKRLRSVK